MELHFDPHSSLPLYGQIYEQIRQGILQGQLPAGSRLPASRQLAEQHGLARVTVTAAYDQLRAEGYVVSRTGAGTYVAENLPIVESPMERAPFTPEIRLPLSQWGQRVVTYGADHVEQNGRTRVEIDFGFGRSFPHIFPYDVWRRLLARYLSTDDAMLSRYGSAAGFEPLRRSVAGYLGRLRGVHCAAEQVVIVSGVQQALDILARLLLNPGDAAIVETPGYADAFDLLRAHGARLLAVPVDDHGFPPERIPPDSRARLAFVTPSNQFPRGGTMPLARRLALLEWAEAAGAMIIEDDYDSELRYSGHPLAALQGLDESGRVIYLGTFSKVLFPALRLGYVVLPEPLLTPFLRAKGLMDRGAPTLMQAAVSDFISEGHFERHLRRLRKEYGERRRVLVQTLSACLNNKAHWSSTEAGLHVMLYLSPHYQEEEVVQRAEAAGVRVYPGAPYHLNRPAQPSILLGFSGLSAEEIVEGVRRLAAVLGRMKDEG